jgi:hypothetical protein
LILLGCSDVSTEIVKTIYKHKNKLFKKISSFFFLLTSIHLSLPDSSAGWLRMMQEDTPAATTSWLFFVQKASFNPAKSLYLPPFRFPIKSFLSQQARGAWWISLPVFK